MKKIFSYIIWFVLLSILFFHNWVMAFWSDIKEEKTSEKIIEHSMPDCHEKTDIKDCKSLCCLNHDIYATNYCFSTQNNKKKIDKLKYCFIDLDLYISSLLDFNFIWNISPPWNFKKLKNEYISLIPWIKSNT